MNQEVGGIFRVCSGASRDDAVCCTEITAKHKIHAISVIRLVFLLSHTMEAPHEVRHCLSVAHWGSSLFFFYRLFITLTFYSCTDVPDGNPLMNELIKAAAERRVRRGVLWPGSALSSGSTFTVFTRVNSSKSMLWWLVYFTLQAVSLLFMSNKLCKTHMVKISHKATHITSDSGRLSPHTSMTIIFKWKGRRVSSPFWMG